MAPTIDPENLMQVLESRTTDEDKGKNHDEIRAMTRLNLMRLAKHLNIEFKQNIKKAEIYELVLYFLVGEDLILDSVLDKEEGEASEDASELLKAEVFKLKTETESNRLKAEAERLKAEAETKSTQKVKDAEIEKAKAETAKLEAETEALKAETARKNAEVLDIQSRIQSRAEGRYVESSFPPRDQSSNFDPTKHMRLVPAFNEKDPDSFFQTFEHIAAQCKWPKESLTLLVSTQLRGRALSIYSALSIAEKVDYDSVKAAVLKGYQLVPEAYRQQFRTLKHHENTTHVEYIRQKVRLFDLWTKSRGVDDFKGLRNLMLVEDFKDNLAKNVKSHIEDLDVVDLDEAAKRADDYTITHRLSNVQASSSNSGNGKGQKEQSKGRNQGGGKWSGSKSATNVDTPNESTGSQRAGGQKYRPARPYDASTYCDFHKVRGHSTENCYTANKLKGSTEKPVQTVSGGQAKSSDRSKTQVVSLTIASNPPKDQYINVGLEYPRGQCNLEYINESTRSKDVMEPLSSEVNENSETRSQNSLEPPRQDQCVQGTVYSTLKSYHTQGPESSINSQCTIKSGLNQAAVTSELGQDDLDRFKPFTSVGQVTPCNVEEGPSTQITILRDTGASQSLILQSHLTGGSYTGSHVLVTGVGGKVSTIPLYEINLESNLVKGDVIVGAVQSLPVSGVQMLLGNDLAGSRVVPDPVVTENPNTMDNSEDLQENFPGIFPACVTTRAQTKSMQSVKDTDIDLSKTFLAHDRPVSPEINMQFTRAKLIEAQQTDPEIAELKQGVLTLDESDKVPTCYFMQNGVLVRKWRNPLSPVKHSWETKYQVVLPECLRIHALELAHDAVMGGHMGVKKTYHKLTESFWWKGIRRNVAEYCRTCHVCQMTGKPNQRPKKAPLQPIAVIHEPFTRIIIDCVGPLPATTSRNQYLLTILDTASRYPEAIPLKNITAQSVVKALLKFFTVYGLPLVIQSDRGSNFTSNLFAQVAAELGIEHQCSTAYHAESQGALERYHATLKTMIKAYVSTHTRDWDLGIPYLLFATRSSIQESLGFTPNELVFGHTVRGPLKLMKDKCLGKIDDEDDVTDVLSYVIKMKERLSEACEVAKTNLKDTQDQMKQWYDQGTSQREYAEGDLVIILLPNPGDPLSSSYTGPCRVLEKVDKLNYVVSTPMRRKKAQKCHVNIMKTYHARVQTVASVASPVDSENEITTAPPVDLESEHNKCELDFGGVPQPIKLNNSQALANLENKLLHLTPTQRSEMTSLIRDNEQLFPDVPGKASGMFHDVDVGDNRPIKQHPYRVSPQKRDIIRKEVEYMLNNKIIQPCDSQWASPCLLVPKPDKSARFCTDYRFVNKITKTDSYPLPRVDDLIDQIGEARFVSKFDLLKGYWQIPLTARARDISSFVTPDGLYQYLVTPFGMKNSGCTFQRFMNQVVSELPHTKVYVDDIIIYTNTWEEHVSAILALFSRLTEHNLTVNLVKSEFAKATVQFLGHMVGQGQISPVMAKVEAINSFPVPDNKKALMRYLGMCGYYRKFCKNFSEVITPLTGLLKKGIGYRWTENCQTAFDNVKSLLTNAPVLMAPDFQKPFKLYCDASDVGVGAVLTQEASDGLEHPISYYSKKLDKAQKNYATVEKEALSLLLALRHYDVYLSSSPHTIQVFTDHNPLVFVNRMKLHNQRLLRWSLTLQEFDINISHVRGRDNVVSDALSRS